MDRITIQLRNIEDYRYTCECDIYKDIRGVYHADATLSKLLRECIFLEAVEPTKNPLFLLDQLNNLTLNGRVFQLKVLNELLDTTTDVSMIYDYTRNLVDSLEELRVYW